MKLAHITAAVAGLIMAVWSYRAEAAPTAPHPLWGSDELRAARGLAEEPALLFDVEAETSRKGVVETETFTVTLAPTFTFVDRGASKHLEDHALCRSASWKDGQQKLDHMNCHAMVGFRRIELANRQMIGRVLAAADRRIVGDHAYLSEAELGVEAETARRLGVTRTGQKTEARLGGRRVASIEGTAGGVSADETRRVKRFFSRTEPLHPQVRVLLPTDTLPAVVAFERKGMRFGDEHRVLRISNVRRSNVAYPLPQGFSAELGQAVGDESTPRQQALARASAVLAGEATKPTPDFIEAELRAAVEAGRGLHGLLLLIELSQLYPDVSLRGDPLMARLSELMRASDDVAQFMTANRLAGDPKAVGDRQAAAHFLTTKAMTSAPFNSFRYVTYANLLSGAGDTKEWDPAIAQSMPKTLVDNYWLHVAAYPWASGAYKDVGDAYFRMYQPQDAWAAYDLGRAIDPNWAKGPMKAIETFELQLRAQEPDFF
jgi:hypothetical protein